MVASKNNDTLETFTPVQGDHNAEGPVAHHMIDAERFKKWRNKFRFERKSILLPLILSTIAFILIFASVPVIWANKTAFSAGGFVSVLEKIAKDPQLQRDITASGTDYFMEEVEAATEAFPFGLGGIFQQSLRSTIDRGLAHAVEDEQFQQAWKDSLRKTHESMIKRVDSQESIEDAEGIPIVIQPLFNYLSTSIYRQLGFFPQDSAVDGEDETAASGIIHVGDSKALEALRTLRASNPIAILLLAAALIMIIITIIIAKRPAATVGILGSVLVAVAAVWYGCSVLFEKVMADGIHPRAWANEFTERVAFEVAADFRIWVVTAALLGFLIMAGGTISIFVNKLGRSGRPGKNNRKML